ncbi:uncharacterized protein LAESUDRAFT_721509 [Laetiporus sulphureus 93-53]|uniref:Zn(2)-C6 fungal-type domain-containing protein n=1 Tax=Laetiporus sulphureus 93-53 TaxID=1314785 RepID=A0A165H0L9_9APHY|nr:uncharacterized protein LAESUDRAFT_721509 [Laetiporus sulphureus 93-53]KZT11087.1 hypothetical protein LAESUDRAFT_721509 [Laetiporus sulphureus 93-53]
MADTPDASESAAESVDEGQLTIRIPNPKVYMARQSQWKGRRGKPRCDHCRLNNLKCDRVLPVCNYCSWSASGRECKYTPLPTPAHRGIPRCDRCRLKNLKCDRSLPVCNHCAEEKEDDCNYTPKKRHKVPSDHAAAKDRPVAPYAAKTASFLVSEMLSEEATPEQGTPSGPSGSNIFEGEIRTEPQIKQYVPPTSPIPIDEDIIKNADSELFQQVGPDGTTTWVRKIALPPLKNGSSSTHSTYHRPFLLDQGMIVTTPHVDPWVHPDFVSLPDVVLQTLTSVNAIEMPTRHSFEEALIRFASGLSPELRETATFIPEVYAEVAHAISEGHIAGLSPRLQMWVTCHHARAGSHKRHLILLPRDAFYNMNRADEEKLRGNYINQTDGEVDKNKPVPLDENGLGSLEAAAVFERVPIQQQIYDVLVYTHRSHGSSSTMLFEARRIGMATITWPMVELFIRLCPLCKLRAKGPRIPADEDTAAPRPSLSRR